jgi:hypothetical protein
VQSFVSVGHRSKEIDSTTRVGSQIVGLQPDFTSLALAATGSILKRVTLVDTGGQERVTLKVQHLTVALVETRM